jgi:hypothetical protein
MATFTISNTVRSKASSPAAGCPARTAISTQQQQQRRRDGATAPAPLSFAMLRALSSGCGEDVRRSTRGHQVQEAPGEARRRTRIPPTDNRLFMLLAICMRAFAKKKTTPAEQIASNANRVDQIRTAGQ